MYYHICSPVRLSSVAFEIPREFIEKPREFIDIFINSFCGGMRFISRRNPDTSAPWPRDGKCGRMRDQYQPGREGLPTGKGGSFPAEEGGNAIEEGGGALSPEEKSMRRGRDVFFSPKDLRHAGETESIFRRRSGRETAVVDARGGWAEVSIRPSRCRSGRSPRP